MNRYGYLGLLCDGLFGFEGIGQDLSALAWFFFRRSLVVRSAIVRLLLRDSQISLGMIAGVIHRDALPCLVNLSQLKGLKFPHVKHSWYAFLVVCHLIRRAV